jgi:hypothetical protein
LTESLGSSPDAVAANLAALRAHGTPSNSSECAIARYLRAIVGAEMAVADLAVSDRRVHIIRADRHMPMTVRLPAAVTKFIRAFDDGCYPELVEVPRSRARSLIALLEQ